MLCFMKRRIPATKGGGTAALRMRLIDDIAGCLRAAISLAQAV
jgi:hypothetical protein